MHTKRLTTYAPHNGHTGEDRKQQWVEVKEIMNKTCKRQTILWRTDANGPIGREEEGGKGQKDSAVRSIIGPYTRSAKAEKGNGTRLQKIYPETQSDTDDIMEENKDGKRLGVEYTGVEKIWPMKYRKRK